MCVIEAANEPNIGSLAIKSAVLQENSGLNVVAPARLASLLLKRFILRANSFAVFFMALHRMSNQGQSGSLLPGQINMK